MLEAVSVTAPVLVTLRLVPTVVAPKVVAWLAPVVWVVSVVPTVPDTFNAPAAKAQDTSSSDIDLMIVSDSLSYRDVFSALEKASIDLGRTVNPTVYTSREFERRVHDRKVFVTRVMNQPKLWLIGDERGLTA
jgi:hypothetical protein